MTRDEDAIIEEKKYYRNDIKCYDAFLHGVEWAEGQIANVWHDASEEPKDGYLLFQFGENKYDTMFLRYYFGESIWKIWCREKKITRWAYINDLLPKQFGNSEQPKGGEK